MSTDNAEINWVEIPAELPPCWQRWVEQNVDPDNIKEVPPPHVTLLYGFDPKLRKQVEEDVKRAGCVTDDWVFDRPRPGDKARNAWLLPFTSRKLEDLFWTLCAKYPNQHYLHEGKFDPHITLCYTKKDIH